MRMSARLYVAISMLVMAWLIVGLIGGGRTLDAQFSNFGLQYSTGTSAPPATCTSPSLYIRLTGASDGTPYWCEGGVYVAGGGGGVVGSGTAGTITEWTGAAAIGNSLGPATDDGSIFTYSGLSGISSPSYASNGAGAWVASGTEGTCAGAGASQDVLCLGDLTTHSPLLSLNGGTFFQLPHFGAALTGTKCLQTSGTTGLLAETAGVCGGAPSLDLVTGSAAQATANETAISHEWTYNGVETANLTTPIVFQNTDAGANTSFALGVNTAGVGANQLGLVSNSTSAATTSKLFYGSSGGTFTSGVLSAQTEEFEVDATGDTSILGNVCIGVISVTCASPSASARLTPSSLTYNTQASTYTLSTLVSSSASNSSSLTLSTGNYTAATASKASGNILEATGNLTNATSPSTQTTGTVTIQSGDITGATNAGGATGALTIRGGDQTTSGSGVVANGGITIRGGNNTSTASTSTAGSVVIQGGGCTSNTVLPACNGTVKLLQAFFTTGTATVHSLACVTATNTVATCTSAANGTNSVGWIDSVSGSTVFVQMGAFGQVVTGLALSAAFTAGQWACADTATTAGDMVASATKCPAGVPGGVVLTTATTTTPVFITSETL